MSAAGLSPTPISMIGVVSAGIQTEVWAEGSDCPACGHPFTEETHSEVYPGGALPPMLLCFVMVGGRQCFARCGACRRGLP